MKQILIRFCAGFAAVFWLLVGLGPRMRRYTVTVWDCFDTITQIIGYAPSQEEFKAAADAAVDSFSELHRCYDRFFEESGSAGLAALNRSAGSGAVTVERPLFALLEYALWAREITGGAVDIRLGPVIELWRREISASAGAEGTPPSQEALRLAERSAFSGEILLDSERCMVQLTSKNMLLDVGAIAKGYAVDRAAEALRGAGLTHFAISGGGTVRVYGSDDWPIGIQDPDAALLGSSEALARIALQNESIATSGDHQRYFLYAGKRMHHLIDPDTLLPADRYRQVTVVTSRAADADLLSTALFVLDLEDGRALAAQFGAEAYWLFPDGSSEMTDGLRSRLLK